MSKIRHRFFQSFVIIKVLRKKSKTFRNKDDRLRGLFSSYPKYDKCNERRCNNKITHRKNGTFLADLFKKIKLNETRSHQAEDSFQL